MRLPNRALFKAMLKKGSKYYILHNYPWRGLNIRTTCRENKTPSTKSTPATRKDLRTFQYNSQPTGAAIDRTSRRRSEPTSCDQLA